MSIWGAFTNSVEAMQAQSSALGVISQNVANVNTTGYKASTENFQTVLSESTEGQNIFGVQGLTQSQNDIQGNFNSTGVWDNLAINGPGFFILNSSVDGSGSTAFTRAGDFGEAVLNSTDLAASSSASGNTAYLTAGNGDYLMGWQATNGVVDASNSLSDLTAVGVTMGSTLPGQATTQVALQGSIPSNATGQVTAGVPVYDSAGNTQTLQINFTPNGADQWNVSFAVDPDAGTITQQPGTTTSSGTPPTSTFTPASLTFDGAGNYQGVSQPMSVGITWANGTTSTISVDLSKMSQLASGNLQINAATQNGYSSATLVKAEFDSNGDLYGDYSNGQQVLLYQLPVATFTAPNSLQATDGTMFTQTAAAGTLNVNQATALNDTSFTPGAVETSNVDLGTQFSNLITTQTAYNSASKVFDTADKMIQSVRDLIS